MGQLFPDVQGSVQFLQDHLATPQPFQLSIDLMADGIVGNHRHEEQDLSFSCRFGKTHGVKHTELGLRL